MKVLLISDNKENLEILNYELCKNGYDTIIYHWLLKALDNIEEISPDFCIVSVPDYPRHWKILAQFVKNESLRTPCKVILFSSDKLSDEENKKAEELGIFGTIEKLDKNGIKNLLELLNSRNVDKKPEDKVEGIEGKPLSENIEKPRKKSLLARIEAMNDEKQES